MPLLQTAYRCAGVPQKPLNSRSCRTSRSRSIREIGLSLLLLTFPLPSTRQTTSFSFDGCCMASYEMRSGSGHMHALVRHARLEARRSISCRLLLQGPVLGPILFQLIVRKILRQRSDVTAYDSNFIPTAFRWTATAHLSNYSRSLVLTNLPGAYIC